MFSKLKDIASNVSSILSYSKSDLVQDIFVTEIIKNARIDSNYIIECSTVRAAKNAQRRSITEPLIGDKWLILVNCDNFKIPEILDVLSVQTYYGLLLLKTSNNWLYRTVSSSVTASTLGVNLIHVSLSRLYPEDIYALYEILYLRKRKKPIDEDLLTYVCNNYTYDVDVVCELFDTLAAGVVIESKSDIIQLIGLGGVSIESLLLTILTTNEKVSKRRVNKILQMLRTVSWKYNYRTIQNFMRTSLGSFIHLKELMLAGKIYKDIEIIPDAFDIQKIKRVKRYEYALKDITMLNLLCLQSALNRHRTYDNELNIISAVFEYLSSAYRQNYMGA